MRQPPALSAFATLALASWASARGFVVGYLPTWADFPNSVHNIDLGVVTHLDVAFVTPDASGAIALPAGIAEVVQTAHAKGVKVLISLGGGGADANLYGSLLGNPNSAGQFVDHLARAVLDNSLDGVDVDIEGDVLDGKAVTPSQYEAFVTKLATALHADDKLMTAALGGWFADQVTNSAAQQFDLLGVMSYDASGTWSANPSQHSPYQMAVDDYNFWTTAKGVAPDRILVGVPFYGYGWGKYKRAWKYSELVSGFQGAQNQDQIGSGTDVIYYNGMATIHDKAVFAQQKAGGIMIWELTQDAAGPTSLLQVVEGAFGRHDQSVPDNLAKGKPVAVSSTEPGLNVAANATDGNYATRWASLESDPQWLYVDLGEAFLIDEVKISWEAAFGKDYLLQTSSDLASWTTIKTVVGNTLLVNDHPGLSGTGRYLRIFATARGTNFGYSLYELEVYGKPVPSSVTRSHLDSRHPLAHPFHDAIGRRGSSPPGFWPAFTGISGP